MKVGILSDSHKKVGYTKEAINLLKKEGVSYLIHAGDLVLEENLKLLEYSELPYISVFGNNDYALSSLCSKYNIKKEPCYFKILDTTFKLMHLPYYLNGDTNIVISGHTHKFNVEYKNKTLFINPGEVCARDHGKIETVLLEIREDKYILSYYSKDINETNFKKEEYSYER